MMSDKDDPVLDALHTLYSGSYTDKYEKAIAIQNAQARVISTAMAAAEDDPWIAEHVGLTEALAALDEVKK